MNGELTQLLKEIKDWSGKLHDQRHKENLQKFDKIFSKLDNLPCGRHDAWVKILTISNGALWVTIAFLIRLLIQ